MTTRYRIVSESTVRLWGLSCADRLRRQLSRLGAEESASSDPTRAPEDVLLLDGAHLFDARVLSSLVSAKGVMLLGTGSSAETVVAAHVAPESEGAAIEVLSGDRDPSTVAGAAVQRPDALASAFDDRLRRHGPPTIRVVSPENSRELEDRLFADAYKGVTDFVTKFWWPRPARAVTRFCVKYRLTPNMVTSVGLVLVIAACFLFDRGQLGLGLLCGWTMTFLDTVDGKLARVTVSSSKFGHLFDHLTDLVHPPFWYMFWGFGLASFNPLTPGLTLNTCITTIFVAYTVGRLVEGSFQLFLARSGIFLWRRFDSFFRLITARRNPNILLLTGSLLLGRPDLGLEAVLWWTVGSTLVLLLRLFMGLFAKASAGAKSRPMSWLSEVDAHDNSLAVRWFAPNAAGPAAAAESASGAGRTPRGEVGG
jgi:phosphatidylglycerophosphate synthase